jgi:hypothetical protein
MAIKTVYDSSPDQKVNLYIEYDDNGTKIDIRIKVNCSVKECVKRDSIKTYPHGHAEWQNVCTQYGLDTSIHGSITVYKMSDPGCSVDAHVETLNEKISGKPHHIVADYTDKGGTTSIAKGVAL